MHVFVDESGTFSVPKRSNGPSVSCCGALTLPTHRLDEILSSFKALTEEWPKDQGELKGRLLSEDHFDTALGFFAENRLLLEAVAIDVALHEPCEVYRHKERAASNIHLNVGIAHHQSMRNELLALEKTLRGSSLQTYIQAVVMTELIENAFRTNMRWFSLADPQNLSSFTWVVDAKDKQPTNMERLWSTLLLPWLEARSLKEPLLMVTDGDYSHLPSGTLAQSPSPPAHLAPHLKYQASPFRTVDIKAVFANRRFADSRDEIGLSMVDIAVSAVRRGMMGSLQRSGWRKLGSLLVRPAADREAISLVRLSKRDLRWEPRPLYERMLLQLRGEIQPVVPPS